MGFKLNAYVKERTSAPSIATREITVDPELAKDLESAYQAWKSNPGFVVRVDFDAESEVKSFFEQAHYWAYHRASGRVAIRKIGDEANSKTSQVFRVADPPTEAQTAYNSVANARAALKKARKNGLTAEVISSLETKLADTIVRARGLGVEVKD